MVRIHFGRKGKKMEEGLIEEGKRSCE